MDDFITWVLLRLDVLMAASKDRSGDSRPAPKRSPERILPFGVVDGPDTADPAPPRPAA